MNKMFLAVLAMSVLYGCKRDQLDFSNSNVTLEPTFVVPLASIEMNLGNMVEDLDEISSDSSGNLLVYYRDNSAVPPIRATDLFQLPQNFGIPNAQFPLGNAAIDPIDLTVSTSLNTINQSWSGALSSQIQTIGGTSALFPSFSNELGGTHTLSIPSNFSNGVISTGFLELELTNQWPIDLQNVSVDLKESGVTVGSFSIASIPAGGVGSSTVALNGQTLGSSFTIEVTSMSSPGSSSAVMVDLSEQLIWHVLSVSTNVQNGNAVLSNQSFFESSSLVDIALDDEEITLLELLEGSLDFNLNSDIGQETLLEVTFLEGLDAQGDTLRVQIPIPANGSAQGSADLSGGVISLDQSISQPFNRFTLKFEAFVVNSNGVVHSISSSNEISGSIEFNGFQFKYVEGFFGSSIEDLTGNELELDLEFLNRLTGNFQLEDPKIKILTDNGLGAPIRTNFDLIGTSREGVVVPLNLQPSDIAYPSLSEVGMNIKDEILIDRTTSNIVSFLANLPKLMAFDGSIDINPEGNVGTNFLTNSGRLYIGVEVDMGLNLTLTDLGWADTLDLDLTLDNENLDPQTVTIYSNVENGFGLAADIKLVMLGANDTKLDSVSFNFMQPGLTDTEGFVIESVLTETSVELNESQTDALFNSERMVLKATLNTPNNGSTNYVMNVSDFLNIHLALESKAKIILNGN